MRIAVTGASGFIGRHVVRELAARGDAVIAVSRQPNQQWVPGVTPVTLDIGDVGLDLADRLHRPDVVLHLAWDGLPNYQARQHLDSELPRQIAFLDACVEAGVGRITVAGTCMEYGMQQGCLAEASQATPTTFYGDAKDRLRRHMQEKVDAGRLQLTWLRLFYLYGPGQAPTALYSQLRAAIAAGADEFPMSPGDQRRDFLSIEAATRMICTLASVSPGAGVVNVCSGIPIAVKDLVNGWLRDWGIKMTLKTGVYSYPDYEAHDFWGDTCKLNSLVAEK